MNRSTTRELNRIASLFGAWRARYPKGRRPPEPLWAEAVALLDHVPLAVVADRLGVGSARLAARHEAVGAIRAAHEEEASVDTPRVLELEAAHLVPTRGASTVFGASDPHAAPRPGVVEIDRPDGARLRLALPSFDTAALVALCRAFLQTP